MIWWMGQKYMPMDFREGFKQSVECSKAMGLYRQQYCGCLYSEMERYAPRELVKKVFSSRKIDAD